MLQSMYRITVWTPNNMQCTFRHALSILFAPKYDSEMRGRNRCTEWNMLAMEIRFILFASNGNSFSIRLRVCYRYTLSCTFGMIISFFRSYASSASLYWSFIALINGHNNVYFPSSHSEFVHFLTSILWCTMQFLWVVCARAFFFFCSWLFSVSFSRSFFHSHFNAFARKVSNMG